MDPPEQGVLAQEVVEGLEDGVLAEYVAGDEVAGLDTAGEAGSERTRNGHGAFTSEGHETKRDGGVSYACRESRALRRIRTARFCGPGSSRPVR